jgi:hypothetical protein
MFIQEKYFTLVRQIVLAIAVILTAAAAILEPSFGSTADIVFLVYWFLEAE